MSIPTTRASLASLSPTPAILAAGSRPTKTTTTITYDKVGGWLPGFLVGAGLVWAIIYFASPQFMMKVDKDGKPTTELDTFKMAIAIIIGGLIGTQIRT